MRLNNLANLPLGFDTSNRLNVPEGTLGAGHSNPGSSHDVGHEASGMQVPNMQKKSSCTNEIEKIKNNREERRKRMEDIKNHREKRQAENEAHGWKVDVDF